MALKVMNAISLILLVGKLALAFVPAGYFVIANPSAGTLGCAIAWVWVILFTKPASKWQKW